MTSFLPERNIYDEGGTLVFTARNLYASVMHKHRRAGNGKSQTRSAGLSVSVLVHPVEPVEYLIYILLGYTYARIRSILRKAGEQGASEAPLTAVLSDKETELIQKMSEYGAAVEQAGKDYSPSGIANYCYELTKVFNQFYHDYSILNEADEQKKLVRLVIARNVAKVIRNGMALLGIEVPERM